jgi:hypothetical protein
VKCGWVSPVAIVHMPLLAHLDPLVAVPLIHDDLLTLTLEKERDTVRKSDGKRREMK